MSGDFDNWGKNNFKSIFNDFYGPAGMPGYPDKEPMTAYQYKELYEQMKQVEEQIKRKKEFEEREKLEKEKLRWNKIGFENKHEAIAYYREQTSLEERISALEDLLDEKFVEEVVYRNLYEFKKGIGQIDE